jgi:hypothetical protein
LKAAREQPAGPFYLEHAVEVLGLPALQLASLEVCIQVEEIMRIISAACARGRIRICALVEAPLFGPDALCSYDDRGRVD